MKGCCGVHDLLGIVGLEIAHSDRDVRHAAEKTLGKSGVQRTAAALKEHAAVIVAKLEDSNIRVRHAAVTTLGKMEVCDLDEHASAIIAKLGHSDGGVRWALHFGNHSYVPYIAGQDLQWQCH